MNYKQIQRQFKKDQINKTLRLLRWTRVIFHLVTFVNKIDDIALKLIIILLGFQYNIYIKLWEVSYDKTYLEHAEACKYQIETTLIALGE